MKNQFCIPVALQLVLDDIGWFYGADQRSAGLPSRTGINRMHVLEDYEIVESLGKAIGQKINCMLVIGEWDRAGVLSRVPYSNKWGKDWNGSLYYREKEAEKILSFLKSSEHIEFGFHGLLHDSWDEDGNFICDGEFYLPEGMVKGKPKKLVSDEYMRSHFEAFYEIFDQVGFPGPVRSFASPCGIKSFEDLERVCAILKDYGIQFWHNSFPLKLGTLGKGNCFVSNDVIFNKKSVTLCPWEVYDLDPDMIQTYDPSTSGIIGGHWVNLLRFNPRKNHEHLDAWVRYFDRQCSVFGHILSEDVAFAHYQQLYHHYSIVSPKENGVILDLSEADALLPRGVRPDLYVSICVSAGKPACKGGTMTLYDEKIDLITPKNNFYNYKISRTASSVIEIDFVE